jgi:hypothetical protein
MRSGGLFAAPFNAIAPRRNVVDQMEQMPAAAGDDPDMFGLLRRKRWVALQDLRKPGLMKTAIYFSDKLIPFLFCLCRLGILHITSKVVDTFFDEPI